MPLMPLLKSTLSLPKLFKKPEQPGRQTVRDLQAGTIDVRDRIAPAALSLEMDHFAFSNQVYGRVWMVIDYPPSLSRSFVEAIFHFPAHIWIAMHDVPLDTAQVRRELRQQLTSLHANRLSRAQAGQISDYAVEKEAADTESLLVQIEEQDVLYQHAMVIGLFAPSPEELKRQSRQLQDLFADAGITMYPAGFRQESGLHSLSPLGVHALADQRNMDPAALSILFPFTTGVYTAPTGFTYGLNRANGTLVIQDDFERENANTLYIGLQGSGKSFALKDKMEQAILQGMRVYALDIEGEFQVLCEDLGGVYLDMGTRGEQHMNVMDIDPNDQDALVSGFGDLCAWLSVAVGDLTPRERNVVMDGAYRETMRRAGILPDDQATWRNTPPRLGDLYQILREDARPEAQDLADRLTVYAEGLYAHTFNVVTNFRPDNRLVVFGLKGVADTLKPLRIQQIVSFIWANVLRELYPTLVVMDEAWYLMQNDATARGLAEMARRFRKKYAALNVATQHAEDFAQSRYAEVIRDTAAATLLFAQQRSTLPRLKELFGLTDQECRELLIARPGEAIMLTRQHRIPIQVIVPPDRYRLFTTRPQDLVGGGNGQTGSQNSGQTGGQSGGQIRGQSGGSRGNGNGKSSGGQP